MCPPASIITPMGYIPYEYIEYVPALQRVDMKRLYMSCQKNKAPYWRQISPEGYLANLSDGANEWYHLTPRAGCTFESGHIGCPDCANDQGRKNPYPHYIDCDDAFRDLKSVIAPDVDVQRAYVLEQIGKLIEFNEAFSDYSDLYDDGDLENLAERVRGIESLTDLTRLVQGNLPPTYTPLYFLIHGAEIVQNVEFAHSLPAQRAASVEASGIYGRATPSKLTLTREVSDFYIAGNGYIFAYEHNDYMDGMGNLAVHFSTFLSGTAEFGLKFYFIPDQEYQLIIPVKCIQDYQVDEWPDEYTPPAGWPDDMGHTMLPDPKDTQQ